MKSTASKRVPQADLGPSNHIEKLAERLGLSRTTISMILNDVPEAIRFPEKTRQRVVESAKRLGYRPNDSLGRVRTYLIGVIAPDFGNGFEAAVLSGFERRPLNIGYTSFIYLLICDPHHFSICQVPLSEWIMRGRKSRIHIDGLPALLDRFVRKMRNEKKLGQIGIDDQGTVDPDFQPSSFRPWFRCYDLTGPGVRNINGARVHTRD